MDQEFTALLVRVSDGMAIAECTDVFVGGAAIREYTPEGCQWILVGYHGEIRRATPELINRVIDSLLEPWAGTSRVTMDPMDMWYDIISLRLPRLDMNVDFLKRSLEIDDWSQNQYLVSCTRDVNRMESESDCLYHAVREAVGGSNNLFDFVRSQRDSLFLNPLTTVMRSDCSAFWMWGAYSGDLSAMQVLQIHSDPSGVFEITAYYPFGKAAACWRMIRNHVNQRRIFFYWRELPARGSKSEADKREAIAAYATFPLSTSFPMSNGNHP
jgi:hypothetical protein